MHFLLTSCILNIFKSGTGLREAGLASKRRGGQQLVLLTANLVSKEALRIVGD
jgi:hypothetical protein